MIINKVLSTLAVGLLSSVACADFITGTVVDSNGVPVGGVNISARDVVGGGNGNLANGGTDANGFFNSTIDPGTYELTFEPPRPPAAVALVTVLDNVVVAGVTSLGTVALDPAVALNVRFLDPNHVPVQGLNLDVFELSTGLEYLELIGDSPDVLGWVHMSVPVGEIRLVINTAPSLVPLLAPDQIEFDTTQGGDIGDLTLEFGYVVSAAVLRTNFQPVQNLDVDVIDSWTGEERNTPGDNTDNNGFVDFILPVGTFDIEFCPQLNENLVALLMPAVSITGTTNLGIVTLADGVRLSGNVTTYLGLPAPGVDIDVTDSGTLLDVMICGDNTNAAGDYDIVVPTGTFDLSFEPRYSEKLGSAFANNVVVAGNTIRNAVLPFCDCGAPSGAGTPGSGGIVPTLTATGGALRLGNPGWSCEVGQGRGGAFGVATFGFGSFCGSGLRPTFTSMGQFGLVSQLRMQTFRLDGAPGVPGVGSAAIEIHLPDDLAFAGMRLSGRAQVFDAAAANGRANSRILCGVLCQ